MVPPVTTTASGDTREATPVATKAPTLEAKEVATTAPTLEAKEVTTTAPAPEARVVATTPGRVTRATTRAAARAARGKQHKGSKDKDQDMEDPGEQGQRQESQRVGWSQYPIGCGGVMWGCTTRCSGWCATDFGRSRTRWIASELTQIRQVWAFSSWQMT